MTRLSIVTIHRDALRHNLRRVREIAPHSKVMVPVKCDAYGHGMRDVVNSLDNCDAFAVAYLDEALNIRPITDKPIIVLEGLYHANEFILASKYKCEIVIHCQQQLEMLQQYNGSEKFDIWLKINTGMCRLGIDPKDFHYFWQQLTESKNVNQPVKLMTHFANADDPNDVTTEMQIELFEKTTAGVNTITSLANSGGILGWPNSHSDWVRPGIMLYGISPFQGEIGKNHQLLPAMTVTSTIIAIRQCRKGDRVGYGGTWVCPENMPVGIIAIGYGDGYPRSLPSGTPVYIEGKLAPTVGTVSMDMIAIDLRRHPTADIGTTVLLWGNELPIEVLAQKANTIAYEIICNINQRLIRNLV